MNAIKTQLYWKNGYKRIKGKRFVSHQVVLVRHGESIWNQENRFTGWCDVGLTEHGVCDAVDAGSLMGERGMKFDVCFTSTLERAWKTSDIALEAAEQTDTCETIRSWRLNERHYGALQGHLKDSIKLIDTFGEEKILEWRRSYDVPPPSLYDQQFANDMGSETYNRRSTTLMNPRYIDKRLISRTIASRSSSNNIESSSNYSGSDFPYPSCESLKDCEARAYSFWLEVIAPRVKAGDRVLIVCHANTIRALIKAIDQIDDSMIKYLKIPNGIPLVYTMDKDLNPILDLTDDLGVQANYLVSARNHSKMMSYERCVRKKLRSLFEYLDTDNDGRITPSCLQNGLIKLQNYGHKRSINIGSNRDNSGSNDGDNNSDFINNDLINSKNNSINNDRNNSNNNNDKNNDKNNQNQYSNICEYEIEELLRAVPSADEHGGVTLQAFLKSEATLLPKLSRLRLLQ